MPNLISYPMDRHLPQRTSSAPEPNIELLLPGSWLEAILRGARSQCPRCGASPLFGRFLKPVPACSHCGQDWSLQSADDFPAYLSILITGHLMVPLIITLTSEFDLSVAALAAIILPLITLLTVGLLQPAKGAVIATQWWLGMNGFKLERSDPREHSEDLPAEPANSVSEPGPRKSNSFSSLADDSHVSRINDASQKRPTDRLHAGGPSAIQPCNAKLFRNRHDSLH